MKISDIVANTIDRLPTIGLNKITKTNIELLRILDVIRFVREIPGTTPDEACNRLKIIIGQLSKENVKTVVMLVLKYNPAVQALCGAMLENINADELLNPSVKSIVSSYRMIHFAF